MVFKDLYELLPPEEAETCRRGNERVFFSGKAVSTEEWVANYRGEKRLISIRKTPQMDQQGRVRQVVCTGEDVISQRTAHQALLNSEERFALAMEASGGGLWDWNIETGEVYYSPAYALMLGYESTEIPPHVTTWQELIHPEDREKAMQANWECIENRRDSFRVEFRMQTKAGQWRWIAGKGKAAARDERGRATRMVGTHSDITERRQTEEELRKSEEKFKNIFNRSPLAIEVFDAHGQLMLINPMGKPYRIKELMAEIRNILDARE